jgi:superfamily II DNA/RNA helicase
MTFEDLGLGPDVLKAVTDAGYRVPTAIQEKAIPVALQGRDLLGCAQTGTGKTAAFVLPMIDILSGSRAKARMPRALILSPTRELAQQTFENFEIYAKSSELDAALLIGGTSMRDQEKVLESDIDVLIATPGRLLDLVERGQILMRGVKYLVIDEADRMLDMGFIPDVERIVSFLPPLRQTLMFSATMPKEIRKLADKFLHNPKEITVAAPSSPAEMVEQCLIRVANAREKNKALRILLESEAVGNAMIFVNRKRDVDSLTRSLKRFGFNVVRMQGDMDQRSREAALNAFKSGEARFMVCTDVAGRGIDIFGLSHVFCYDVPVNAEDYVHRIGRTGRAGHRGRAYIFATPEEAKGLAAITRLIRRDITEVGIDALPGLIDHSTAADDTSAVEETVHVAEQVEVEEPTKAAEPAKAGNDTKAVEKIAEPKSTRAKPAAKKESPAASAREPERGKSAARERKPPRSRSHQDDDGKSPVGMGDHVPAFLTRSILIDDDDGKDARSA